MGALDEVVAVDAIHDVARALVEVGEELLVGARGECAARGRAVADANSTRTDLRVRLVRIRMRMRKMEREEGGEPQGSE